MLSMQHESKQKYSYGKDYGLDKMIYTILFDSSSSNRIQFEL